jgi:sporulation-control protein
MFKRMLAAFGVGGPSVDTVLNSPHAMPGQVVTGQVRIQGGTADAMIDQIVLSLVTRAEVEYGDHEGHGTAELIKVSAAQGVRIAAGQRVDIPFQLPIPWEAPITAVSGNRLPGMTVGVRTVLMISGAVDPGDLDPIDIHPLPSQDRVLGAFGHLGFRFRSADVEAGRLHGVPQQLGVFQEIEFMPPPQLAGRVNEVELTFVATPHELYVVLEADKRGGLFQAGGDSFGRFAMTHQDSERADWAGLIGTWLEQLAGRRGAFGGGGHNPAFGGGHQQAYNPHHGHRRGPGMGMMAGGIAAGVVGGMVAGEVAEEAFESFGGDDFGGFEE